MTFATPQLPSSGPARRKRLLPAGGEHPREILADLGLGDAEMDQ